MKLLIEVVISIVFHPIAVVLTWINIVGRTDLTPLQKGIWAAVCLVWGIGPLLYISVGGGDLW